MELTTAMLADAAALHEGKLFVHGGGWDNITTNQFPTTHPSMAVVLVLSVAYSEALDPVDLRVELVDEDGRQAGVSVSGKMALGHAPGTKRGQQVLAPVVLPLVNVTFSKPGRYVFEIEVNGKSVGSVPFTVQTPPLMSPPGPASVTPPTR